MALVRRAESERRADTAWSVRVAGGTWADAARLAGFSSAQNAYRAVLRRRGQLPVSERGDLRDIWRIRLESFWRQAALDVQDRRPGAITHAVRLASAAMQLDGLAAPTKVDISTESEIASLIEALLTPQVVPGQVLDDGPGEG
jgi:hypothetical protein